MKSRVSKVAFMFLMMFSLSTISTWVVPVLSASTIGDDISKQEFASEELNGFGVYFNVYWTDMVWKGGNQ